MTAAPALYWYIDPDGSEHGPFVQAEWDDMPADTPGRLLTDDERAEYWPQGETAWPA